MSGGLERELTEDYSDLLPSKSTKLQPSVNQADSNTSKNEPDDWLQPSTNQAGSNSSKKEPDEWPWRSSNIGAPSQEPKSRDN